MDGIKRRSARHSRRSTQCSSLPLCIEYCAVRAYASIRPHYCCCYYCYFYSPFLHLATSPTKTSSSSSCRSTFQTKARHAQKLQLIVFKRLRVFSKFFPRRLFSSSVLKRPVFFFFFFFFFFSHRPSRCLPLPLSQALARDSILLLSRPPALFIERHFSRRHSRFRQTLTKHLYSPFSGRLDTNAHVAPTPRTRFALATSSLSSSSSSSSRSALRWRFDTPLSLNPSPCPGARRRTRGSLDHRGPGGERFRDGFSAVQNLRVEHGVRRAGDCRYCTASRTPATLSEFARGGVSPQQNSSSSSCGGGWGAGVEFLDAVEHGAKYGRGRDERETEEGLAAAAATTPLLFSSSSSSSSSSSFVFKRIFLFFLSILL